MSVIRKITDRNIPELQPYAAAGDKQLMRYYEPAPGLFLAESAKVILRAWNAGYEPLSLLMDQDQMETESDKLLEALPDIPVFLTDWNTIKSITGLKMIRGALAVFRRKPLPDYQTIIKDARRIAVLDHVVNPSNVGAVFRSAAALNIDAVLLSRECSDPLYRRTLRVSMGTVFQIPWTIFSDSSFWPETGMKQLKHMGFRTVAMALTENSVNVNDPALKSENRLAILLGNEGYGLSEELTAACDYRVCIPMAHGVDSLNVAAASAVAFWELGK
jgi:tRNA G18 (ribose-2'-O)-methylase SpoU